VSVSVGVIKTRQQGWSQCIPVRVGARETFYECLHLCAGHHALGTAIGIHSVPCQQTSQCQHWDSFLLTQLHWLALLQTPTVTQTED